MRFLEALNRFLVGMLLSLVILQAGLLFFMKNMEDQAQYKLVQNTSKVDAKCGEETFSDENYWNLLQTNTLSQSTCEGSDCVFSHISWDRSSQPTDLQVISVQTAPPFRWGEMDQGGSIRVRVKESVKPQVIALVSRQRLEWSFQVDKNAKIEKVVVATPEVVWLQGLPPKTPIEYLPKEKMCSYPYTWEEAFNPDNEFRVLSSVLKKITGLEVSSFQGAITGKEFRLPMFDKSRGLASVVENAAENIPKENVSTVAIENVGANLKETVALRASGNKSNEKQRVPLAPPASPVIWARQEKSILPQKVRFAGEEILLPERTQQVFIVENQVFILKGYLLWRWNPNKKEFAKMYLPSSMHQAQYIKAAAWSASQKALYIYNDERGGEMYQWNLAKNQWTELSTGYAYNLEALYYDEQEQSLRAVASRGPHLTQFLKMDQKAKVKEVLPLKEKIAFDKKNWKWELQKNKNVYSMRFYQAVSPQGQDVLLEL